MRFQKCDIEDGSEWRTWGGFGRGLCQLKKPTAVASSNKRFVVSVLGSSHELAIWNVNVYDNSAKLSKLYLEVFDLWSEYFQTSRTLSLNMWLSEFCTAFLSSYSHSEAAHLAYAGSAASFTRPGDLALIGWKASEHTKKEEASFWSHSWNFGRRGKSSLRRKWSGVGGAGLWSISGSCCSIFDAYLGNIPMLFSDW